MANFLAEIGHVAAEPDEAADYYLTDDERNGLYIKQASIKEISGKKLPMAFINEAILRNDFFKRVLKHYFEQEVSLRPESIFEGLVIKNSTIKILDRSSYGLYTDIICSQAKEYSFNGRKIRAALTSSLLLLDRMNLTKELMMPLEVDYGRSQDAFYVQYSCSLTPLLKEDIFFKSLVKIINDSDLVELSFNTKVNRVILRFCWSLKKLTLWPSLFIYDYKTSLLKHKENDNSLAETKFETSVDEQEFITDDELYEPKASPKQWRLLRRIIKHCLELKESRKESGEEWPDPILVEDIRNIVEEMEDASFEKLNEDEVNILVTSLNSEDPIDHLELLRQDELLEVDPNEYMDSIYSNIADIDVEKVKGAFAEDEETTVISGSTDDDEDVQRVKGKSEVDNSFTVVKGEKEDLDQNHHQLIKGDGSLNKKSSMWQVKKLNVAEKLKDKYSKLENPTPEVVEEELEQTIRDELSKDDNKIDSFVEDIVDAISEELLPRSVPNSLFINKALGELKNTVSAKSKGDGTVAVQSLDVKLMISFTEKLMRKSKAHEDRLNRDGGYTGDHKMTKGQAIIIEQMKESNELLLTEKNKLQKEKNELKAKIIELQREMLSDHNYENVEEREQRSLIDDERQKNIDKLTEDVKSAKSENLELKRQLTVNENEMVKLKTLMARIRNKDPEAKASAAGSDSKKEHRIKQLEKMANQFQDSKNKVEKELASKKSELYSAKLENKTMSGRIKQLEKKLELMNKRKAS